MRAIWATALTALTALTLSGCGGDARPFVTPDDATTTAGPATATRATTTPVATTTAGPTGAPTPAPAPGSSTSMAPGPSTTPGPTTTSSAAAGSFPCVVEPPAKAAPADAREVHPGHVSVVMAMGDSMTAAFAASDWLGEGEGASVARPVGKNAPLEFRAMSFSGGLGSSDHSTLPYFLGQYNSSLTGGSTKRTVPQTPETGYLTSANHLNVALSNAHAHQLEMQIDELKSQSNSIPDFDARWKVLTVFIGANDICDGYSHGFEACDGNTTHRTLLANRYENNLRKTLASIRDSFNHVIVQVVSLFRFGSMKKVREGHAYCGVRRNLLVECNCMDTNINGGSGPVDDAQLDEMDTTISSFNDRIETLAAEFNLQRPDFAVVAVTTGKAQDIPDISYISDLDCFHPSAKAHEALARALWNSMFNSDRTPTPIQESVPVFCPSANSAIYVGDPAPSSPLFEAVSVV